MNKYVYGKFPAAVNLEKIIEELDNKNHSRKVGAIISECYCHLSYVRFIPDLSVWKTLWRVLYNDYLSRVETTKVPEVVQSHLKNVLNTIFKNEYRRCVLGRAESRPKQKQESDRLLAKYVKEFQEWTAKGT